MLTNRKKKMLGTAAFAAMLAAGGVAGAALGAPIVAGAQDETDTAPSGDCHDFGRPGHPPFGLRFGRSVLGVAADTAAEALGVSNDELRDALRDGRTIAEIAEAEGVDAQSVIDALVTEAESRIDEAVEEGDLDTDQADELKAELTDRITDAVNGEGRGWGRFG